MDELVRWLGEQLDEDERIARATHPVFLAWDYDDCVMQIRDLGNGNEIANVLPRHAYGEHIAEHDPARVLRDIQSDRILLAAYASAQESLDATAHPDMYDVGRTQGLEEAVRYRALRFSGRPGYLDKWRP